MSLRVLHDSSERWNYLWARNSTDNFALKPTSTIHSRVLLHAVNLRHETDGFTSPPKEGVLWSFSPLKIRRLQPVLNPRTWVLKASTLIRPPKPLSYTVTSSENSLQNYYKDLFFNSVRVSFLHCKCIVVLQVK
jgi:hypothetical protein